MKAVFLDYTGTMVREDEPYTQKLISMFLAHSDFKEPQAAVEIVWTLIKQIEAECYGEAFIGKDEMADRILAYCAEHYHLTGDLEKFHDVWRKSWIHAPLFDDVKPFFERCPCPIYVITNDDLCYVEQSVEEKGLRPAGIVSAQMVRACKPHVEIFEEALRISGCRPGEVVHIGDSVTSDVKSALQAGIRPILLDRKKDRTCPGVTTVGSLLQVLDMGLLG